MVEEWKMDGIERVWEYKVDVLYCGHDGGLAFVVGGLPVFGKGRHHLTRQ